MFNTLNQMDRFTSDRAYDPLVPSLDNDFLSYQMSDYLNLIALVDTSDRESYLRWVSVWKRMVANLEDCIRQMKRGRNDPRFYREIGGKFNEQNRSWVESDLRNLQHLARLMYKSRKDASRVSYLNKIVDETSRILAAANGSKIIKKRVRKAKVVVPRKAKAIKKIQATKKVA